MASNFSVKRELNQVLFDGDSYFKKVTLNRPNKLNSLNYEMGNGNAFCAGGDVVSAVTSVIAGHWSYGARFYEKQFNLDYLLATYKKPLIPLIDGIVMGGGAGLTMHGRFRIVTEKAVFAMPEVSIGLFPDLGASHFLSRLPGYFGEYLGLTGARVDGAEMLACGLATHFVFSQDLLNLENALQKQTSSEMTVIYKVIEKFAQNPKIKENTTYNRLEIINKCFSKDTVQEILLALENEVKNKAENWIIKAINSIKSASPISLKITLRSIKEGRQQNLKQCFIREYTICCNVLRATISRDFFEGSRAMLFDKDKKPKWDPPKLELVSKDMVDRCFSAIDEDDWEYLQLASRSDTVEKKLHPRL